MAKKLYHIPLQKIENFLKDNRAAFQKLDKQTQDVSYYRELGKSYYILECEVFIQFYKIDKELQYADKTLKYFMSSAFFEPLFSSIALVQNQNSFFTFCYFLHLKQEELFEDFFQRVFLHYHTSYNKETNIIINYQDMSIALLKSKKLKHKESFGEDNAAVFFKLYVDDILIVELKGKTIKTLRKKAYRELFFTLLEDGNIPSRERWNEVQRGKEEAYERVMDMKEL
jgi:thiol-disulfide isomerase/thioredoxin